MRKSNFQLPVAIAVIGAAMIFSITGHWPWQRWSAVSTTEPIVVSSSFRVVEDTLHTGENMATLLGRQGVNGLNLTALAIALSFDPKKIRAGLVFSVHRDGQTDEATHIEFRPNPEQRLQFIRTSTGWVGNAVAVRWTVDTARMAAVITSSLYEAVDRQITEATLVLPERRRLVNELTRVFESSVDFASQVQRGDQFAVVYERLSSEDGDIRYARILAASLTLSEKELAAYHWISADGKDVYYDASGKARQGKFLMQPLEYRYISSRFSPGRFHPILGRMRAHQGTDYAADRGTPVRAAGNGIVVTAGWSGGYGNLVEIQHGNGITTRYGHLSSIMVRVGARVSQSQEVGKVGATGLATGPHLHYEFRVNGVARNPSTLALQAGDPLSKVAMEGFKRDLPTLSELLHRGVVTTVAVAH